MVLIDWQAPWFEGVRHSGAGFKELPSNVATALNSVAVTGGAHLIPQFVSQAMLQEGQAYEAFIYEQGQVPTRDNAHDFFNGLIWLSFPLTKRALNALQAEQIASEGVKATRGSKRDAATLFDENGAILLTQERSLIDAWQARDWLCLFQELRLNWKNAKLIIFGHAALEKLLSPYKAITTHTLWLNMPCHTALEDIDIALAENITRIASKDWQPLPIMGLPDWWARGEQDSDFYLNKAVFR